jgi:hypothetical protein
MDGADAIRYILANNIEGGIVECGVESGTYEYIWIQELMKQKLERDIYMYDTFAGLTAPSEYDYNLVNYNNGIWNTPNAVMQTWKNKIVDTSANNWCCCPLEKVQNRLLSTGYPSSRLHYIVGDVLETLKVEANIPKQIAILRLDTDWYESSKFELVKLYDNVVKGGVIIFDDYYFWNGQRKATDEFFKERGIDYTITKINGQTGAIIKH